MRDSYLDEGFILEKKFGVGSPRRIENAKILVANTAMDTDKIKIMGSKVKVDSTTELANIEEAERVSPLHCYNPFDTAYGRHFAWPVFEFSRPIFAL